MWPEGPELLSRALAPGLVFLFVNLLLKPRALGRLSPPSQTLASPLGK